MCCSDEKSRLGKIAERMMNVPKNAFSIRDMNGKTLTSALLLLQLASICSDSWQPEVRIEHYLYICVWQISFASVKLAPLRIKAM